MAPDIIRTIKKLLCSDDEKMQAEMCRLWMRHSIPVPAEKPIEDENLKRVRGMSDDELLEVIRQHMSHEEESEDTVQ